MIDFRYHVVSLISVFLALAVGIVLGAGPLRESFADQLTGQVEQLRTEQDRLRTSNEELSARNDQLASFVAESTPELVRDGLAGKRVAMITDDASTSASLDRTERVLEQAGARPGARISLRPVLRDPTAEPERAAAVAALREVQPDLLPEGGSSAEQIAGAVVALLGPAGATGLGTEDRRAAWDELTGAKLVDVDGDPTAGADALIIASADPETLTVPGEADDVAAERARQVQLLHTAMLTAIAQREIPAVVAGVTPADDVARSILRTVRSDARFAPLSTTDRLQEPDGPTLAVLALIEQVHGGSGHYGTAAGAQERMPASAHEFVGRGGAGAASDGGGEG